MLFRFALVAFILTCTTTALAGPLDALVAEMTGLDTAGWWAEAVITVGAAAALLAALTPLGSPGGMWEKVRRLLNVFGANWGSAKNKGE